MSEAACLEDRDKESVMQSSVVKRSIVVAGHKTSVSLEDAFWSGLKEIAKGRNMSLSDLVASIDAERKHGNLSSAIRLFVLHCCCDKRADRSGMATTPLAVMPAGSAAADPDPVSWSATATTQRQSSR